MDAKAQISETMDAYNDVQAMLEALRGACKGILGTTTFRAEKPEFIRPDRLDDFGDPLNPVVDRLAKLGREMEALIGSAYAEIGQDRFKQLKAKGLM